MFAHPTSYKVGDSSNTPTQTENDLISKGEIMSNNETALMMCGIDTLYFFAQTNDTYEDFFEEVMDQIYLQQALFERYTYEHKNSAILVKIENTSFHYVNKKEGYHWFKEINGYFRMGLKDRDSKAQLHGIQIQLEGVGIYTLGIKRLVDFILYEVILKVTTGVHPITRIDINCFVQYDFGFVNKNMFVSKKKRYRRIDDGNAKENQTIYVGSKPFMLRLYDKRAELKKSEKKQIMEDYFEAHGFSLDQPIYNVEFEMHRQHLRRFNLLDLDNVLSNVSMLFKSAMEDVRLIDTSSITQKDLENNSKNRAKSLPIWDYIKDHFSIDFFLQLKEPLQRLPQKRSIYDMPKFVNDAYTLLNKAIISKLNISPQIMSEITENAIENNAPKEKPVYETNTKKPSDRIGMYVKDMEGKITKRYEIKKDKTVIECVRAWNTMSTPEIEREIQRLEGEIFFGDEEQKHFHEQKLQLAHKELIRRLEG